MIDEYKRAVEKFKSVSKRHALALCDADEAKKRLEVIFERIVIETEGKSQKQKESIAKSSDMYEEKLEHMLDKLREMNIVNAEKEALKVEIDMYRSIISYNKSLSNIV